MADSNLQLQWTDDQWNKVRQVVYEEARKARVAGNVLPLYGPLEPDASYVSKELLSYTQAPPDTRTAQRISVNDEETWPLLTLEVQVFLRNGQIADPELTSALAAFRRAANLLARLEDTIIFNGKPSDKLLEIAQTASEEERKLAQGELDDGLVVALDAIQDGHAFERAAQGALKRELTRALASGTQQANQRANAARNRLEQARKDVQERRRIAGTYRSIVGLLLLPSVCTVTGADTMAGLLEYAAELTGGRSRGDPGEMLVARISDAIGELEGKGYLGPFACVLDQKFFEAVQTPRQGTMVLPQDRILPFLGGGALLRSSILREETGMVIASGGAPIDLVVAKDVSVSFLQVTLEPRFVFRVHEKIALRVKEHGAIVSL